MDVLERADAGVSAVAKHQSRGSVRRNQSLSSQRLPFSDKRPLRIAMSFSSYADRTLADIPLYSSLTPSHAQCLRSYNWARRDSCTRILAATSKRTHKRLATSRSRSANANNEQQSSFRRERELCSEIRNQHHRSARSEKHDRRGKQEFAGIIDHTNHLSCVTTALASSFVIQPVRGYVTSCGNHTVDRTCGLIRGNSNECHHSEA
jgi:hypothetical protein